MWYFWLLWKIYVNFTLRLCFVISLRIIIVSIIYLAPEKNKNRDKNEILEELINNTDIKDEKF